MKKILQGIFTTLKGILAYKSEKEAYLDKQYIDKKAIRLSKEDETVSDQTDSDVQISVFPQDKDISPEKFQDRKRDDSYSKRAPRKRKKKWNISQFDVPVVKGQLRFHDLGLPLGVLHAVCDLKFKYCTPIQAQILPEAILGKDATGRSQTGTGKTAAFLIAAITRILRTPIRKKRRPGTPRVLILAPTRELVLQISAEATELAKYSGVKIVSIIGGMGYEKQHKQIVTKPVDIIVATPGRLLDFQRRKFIFLNQVEILIIDEADRMLDMGFIPEVRKIVYSTPKKENRQTLMFSATLTGEVTRLVSQWTRDPIIVEVQPEQVAVESVEQIVYLVTNADKFMVLFNIIKKQQLNRVLVFCNRKDEVRWLANELNRHGINCSMLSGDIPQKERLRRLEQFKKGNIRVLVATDVAARGIHIEGMDHVINFTLPRDPEDFVHRIGRTGRAGAKGTAVSFADESDGFYIPAIETFIETKLQCIQPHADLLETPEAAETPIPKKRANSQRKKKRPTNRSTFKKFQPDNPKSSK